jgi:protein-tyrosine phosphatase
MVLSLIDDHPAPGMGRVWQSGVIASEDWDNEGLIVSMAGNENWSPPCLWVDIPDNDSYTLPDPMLIAFCDSIVAFLKAGKDVLIHCNEGKFRSTYMDVAVHMRQGMGFQDAAALVKAKHPIAELRAGTSAQLIRMESVLKGVPQ